MGRISAITGLSGLVGYWPCEETSGLTAADKTSSPANAVLSGQGGILRPWNSPGGVGAVGVRPYSTAALTATAASKLNVGDALSIGLFFRRRAALTGPLLQRGALYGSLGSELLAAPGMESALITSGYNGWRDLVATGSGAFVDTSTFHGGSQSIRIDVDASGSQAGVNQGIDSAAAGRYTMTFWYKNDANTAGRASVSVQYVPQAGGSTQYLQTNSTGTWSTASNDALYALPNTATWTQKTLTFDLPETTGTGANGLRIIFKRASGTGGGATYSFWVDDASLKYQATVSGSYALMLTSAGIVQLVAGTGAGLATVASSDPTHPLSDHLGWHNVVATKDGAVAKIYIDGVDRTVAGTNATLSASGTNLTWLSGDSGTAPVVAAHMFLANRAVSAAEQLRIYASANMLPDRAANPKIRVGMCQFSLAFMPQGLNPAVEAAALRSAHITSTREDLGWYNIEASGQGTFNWANADILVNAHSSAGLAMQVTFMPETPAWARSSLYPNNSRYVPGSATKGITVAQANNNATNGGAGTNAYSTWRDRFTAYIVACVHRYKDRVRIWEIGNECNMSIFWGPASSAPLFVDWYNTVRAAIIAELGSDADNHRIVLGGLARYRSEAGSTDANSYTADEFLRTILDLGIHDFDAIGVHPYISNNGSPWTHFVNSTSLDNMHQTRDTLMEYGRGDVLVELNEFGWYTANTTIGPASSGLTLPQSTIAVTDGTKVNNADPVATLGDLGGGTVGGFYVETDQGFQAIGHTGKTGNTMTGCTGGTGTIRAGGRVSFGANPLTEVQQAQYVVDSLAITEDYFSAFCDTWTYFCAFQQQITNGDPFSFNSAWHGLDYARPKRMVTALASAARRHDPSTAGERSECAIYDPELVTTTVINPYADPAGLTYVSNSSMAYWRGKFWAIMDGTTAGFVEGSTGQQIWLATSIDGVVWTPAIQPFRNATYCNNPKTGSTLEWQPNLVVVGDELWCTWSAGDAFISKLTSPTGKWTNYRLEYIDDDQVFLSSNLTSVTSGRTSRMVKDGITDWIVFFSQNPIVLADGTVACPATAYSPGTLSTQTAATNTFTKAIKHNMLVKFASGVGTTTYVDTSAFGDFCAWEPYVVQSATGLVYLFSRSLNMMSSDPDFLLVAVSYDGGETFTKSVSTGMLVPSTRGFARRVSDGRWVLAHVDHAQHSTGSPTQGISTGRRNGALFVSRRGVDDFVPGINFSDDDGLVNYPQFITVGDDLYVHYTSGTGSDVRRSLKLIKVPTPSDDTVAYVHPRRASELDTTTPADPVLHAGPPAHYVFNGASKALSADPLTTSAGVTYTAWFQWTYGGSVILDARSGSSSTAFGSVFMLGGLAINSLNFLHGFTLPPGVVTFLAATIDPSAGTVSLRGCWGGSDFQTLTGYFKTVLFSDQPADGDTLAVNGVTYTFRTSASLTNDVAIGASTAATATNLKAALTANTLAVYQTNNSLRLVFTRADLAAFAVTSGSSAVAADTIPASGGQASVGYPIGSSMLTPYNGKIFEVNAYDSALSVNNLRYLYNQRAGAFGHNLLAGTATAPGDPLIALDPRSPDEEVFPPLGAPAPGYYEVNGPSTLRLHGESSAAVELPHRHTSVTIKFKLSAVPADADKYTIATFGTAVAPARLYVTADNPATVLCDGAPVAALTSILGWNTLTVTVSHGKVAIGSVERSFTGPPRCFLGNAYPEGLLTADKAIDFDTSKMAVQRQSASVQHIPAAEGIACWGDSLTWSSTTGGAQASPTWPQGVASKLGLVVHNGGLGGHGSTEIATRQGGVQPVITLTGNVIPANSTAAITVTAITPTTGWREVNQAGAGLNMPGTLNGHRGTLRHDLTNATANNFTFTPAASSPYPRAVPAATPFVAAEGIGMRGYVNILWTGANNPDSPAATARDMQSMVDWLTGDERYLVISNTYPNPKGGAINTLLAAAHPDNYLDLRSYLINEALADAGITPTGTDLTDISAGNVPTSLRIDSLHFTQTAYNLIGQFIAAEIEDRGWV